MSALEVQQVSEEVCINKQNISFLFLYPTIKLNQQLSLFISYSVIENQHEDKYTPKQLSLDANGK